MTRVEIYSTQLCAYCWRAKDLLDRKGIGYIEIDATMPDVYRAMVKRAGGARSVPQIFIGDRHIGGSAELHDLDSSGGLDSMLEAG